MSFIREKFYLLILRVFFFNPGFGATLSESQHSYADSKSKQTVTHRSRLACFVCISLLALVLRRWVQRTLTRHAVVCSQTQESLCTPNWRHFTSHTDASHRRASSSLEATCFRRCFQCTQMSCTPVTVQSLQAGRVFIYTKAVKIPASSVLRSIGSARCTTEVQLLSIKHPDTGC